MTCWPKTRPEEKREASQKESKTIESLKERSGQRWRCKRDFMYLVMSLLVLRAGCGIWLYQFLIIAYLFTLDQCQKVETCLRKNNSKKAYQLVKDLTTEKQGKTTTIQDKSRKCLTKENEILNRWTEDCSDLHNYETKGTQWCLTAHRYQMQSITLFHEKRWKQQSKRWRWESQPTWITYQQNKSKQEEKPWLTSWPQSATRFGRQENGQPHGLSP